MKFKSWASAQIRPVDNLTSVFERYKSNIISIHSCDELEEYKSRILPGVFIVCGAEQFIVIKEYSIRTYEDYSIDGVSAKVSKKYNSWSEYKGIYHETS